MDLRYQTRDEKGNDTEKIIRTKELVPEEDDFFCRCCMRHRDQSIPVKKIVSGNFTDWAMVGDRVCPDCAAMFSLYFYSYIVDPNGIRLLNVRQIRDEITRQQKPPFLFVITTSQKKHLFYRSKWNYSTGRFAVNLETETIYTTTERMRSMFDLVECLQTLGCKKEQMKAGQISFDTYQKAGGKVVKYLQHELETSREIQIPLFCGQKREISEEEALMILKDTIS